MADYVTDENSNKRKKLFKIKNNHISDKKLTNDFSTSSDFKTYSLFNNIVGYDNIKKIFYFAIRSHLPVHILLVGPPGSAKTLFLMEGMNLQRSYFTLGSHSTKAGMVDYLFVNRPRYLIIDEIEYMAIKDQAMLLSLMETGILSETKFEKKRRSVMKTWVFASCNNEKKLLTPLLSRFIVLHFKKYNYKTFLNITKSILLKECNHELKSRDIRDCIKIGRLSKDSEDINLITNTLKQYKKNDNDLDD